MAYARAVFLGIVFSVLGVASSVNAVAAEEPVSAAAVAVDPDHLLGAGDTVTLQIMEDNDAPVALRVSDTGDLIVPYINRVHVAGRSCSDAAAIISKALEKFYYKATVKLAVDKISLVAPGMAGSVYLSGQITIKGAVPIIPGQKLTVSGAILKAGGPTLYGNLSKVVLTRKNKSGGGAQKFILDIKAVLEKGEVEKDMDVQDGDYINIPQRIITFN